MPVIHVSGFRKTYGSTEAVDDVSFDVNAGEIFVRGVARASETWDHYRIEAGRLTV